MSTAINELRTGHRHLNQLLAVLHRQRNAFEQGRTPDMPLMRDIIDSLNRYAAVGERAEEEALIDELVCHDERLMPARVVLITEHEALCQLGAHCLMVVDAILAGAIVARPELMIPARRYTRQFRAHLRRERAYLCCQPLDTGLAVRHHRPPQRPSPIEALAELRSRIRQAESTRQRDATGTPECLACAIDTTGSVPAMTNPEAEPAQPR